MNKEFQNVMLSDDGINATRAVRNMFDKLLTDIVASCPPSRELSLAKTKLEEACFYAVKAIAQAPGNSET